MRRDLAVNTLMYLVLLLYIPSIPNTNHSLVMMMQPSRHE